MPRAFLVLNKKSKTKQKRCDSDSIDNNTCVNDCLDVKDFADGLIKEIRSNNDTSVGDRDGTQESEDEDGEIDVGGPPCSGRDQWAFSHREGDRDSVTSISPPVHPDNSFPVSPPSVKFEENRRSSLESNNGFTCNSSELRTSDLTKGEGKLIMVYLQDLLRNSSSISTYLVN